MLGGGVVRGILALMQKVLILMLVLSTRSVGADIWSRGAPVPEGGRPNPYEISPNLWPEAVKQGRIHAMVYPVEITGSLLPLRPIQNFLDNPTVNPLRALMQTASVLFTRIHSFKEAMHWLGLHDLPADAGEPSSDIPLPPGFHAGDLMGLSPIATDKGVGFTFGCVGCHSAELFGRPVIGMTNRFPRANVFFIRGRALTRLIATPFFALSMGTDRGESELYRRTRQNMRYISGKRPEVLGLDTSLAHVALSLARRVRDPYATKDWGKALFPDDEPLATMPADSKPAVWWNLKYKNRWLSDGSVVSGNPIITNLLWNEIGRGSDLLELEQWINQNENKVRDLTAAVFASEAPRITEFFPAERIDLTKAKHGQELFAKHCARCHGEYVKAWDSPGAEDLPLADQLRTVLVKYHRDTPVMNVGTDPMRYQGMRSLVRLNELQISKNNGVVVEEQNGYVPPPLVGIWARWPYFHNNSAPSLCAVLTPGDARPPTYWAGEAVDRDRDFDFSCNGYPMGNETPADWKLSWDYFYDSSRVGMGRGGHDRGILLRDGREVLNLEERRDLIQYLQTL